MGALPEDQGRGSDVPSNTGTPAPLGGDSVESQMQLVTFETGQLTNKEYALVYGALYASESVRGLDTYFRPATADLAAVITSFRSHPCPWCETGLYVHRLDIEPQGVQVRCLQVDQSRPVEVWLQGPVSVPAWRWFLAIILWVGIPFASLGMLSWLMPALAAAIQRRRRWAAGAAVWIALLLPFIVLAEVAPESLLFGLVITINLVGGTVYGGLQVKPWVTSLPPPKRHLSASARRD